MRLHEGKEFHDKLSVISAFQGRHCTMRLDENYVSGENGSSSGKKKKKKQKQKVLFATSMACSGK
jgi:hypothetical protein